MAKSSTERSRLRRERLKAKAESYNCYKSKDRERKRTDRSKQKIQSTEEAARLKKLNRKRVAKCRILKTIKIKTKEHQVIPDSEPHQAYKTPQALGKAVGKVNHLLPKSPNQSQHWYLLAVDVRKKFVLALDSKAGNIVKPRVRQAFNKMGAVLNELDPNCNLKEWSFFCNANDDVPQQSNNYDCGIYTCLYARCLAGLGPMVQEACFLQLRQAMLLSLHRGSLHEIPLTIVVLEKYYAADYINKYYVGRALDISNQLIIKFKFLHQVGAQFYWPRRDDTEDKHVSCIFFGPIELSGTGPFTIPMLHEIEQIFNGTR